MKLLIACQEYWIFRCFRSLGHALLVGSSSPWNFCFLFALARRLCFWRHVIVSTFFVYIACLPPVCWSYWCSTYERCLSSSSDLTSPHTLSSFTFSIDRSLAGDSLRSSSSMKSSRLLSSSPSPFLARIWGSKIDTRAFQDLKQQPFLSQIFSSSFATFLHRSRHSPFLLQVWGFVSLNFQCLHVILLRFTHCSPFTISPSFFRHVFCSSLILCLLFPFPRVILVSLKSSLAIISFWKLCRISFRDKIHRSLVY